MTYTIVGTGNIGWFLAKKLTAAGHHCAGVYGRDLEAAKALAASIHTGVFERITEIHDAVADICFLAVTDHIIQRMATQLSFQNTVLVHTAGSVEMSVLSSSAKDYAVLWPVYSILKNNLPNHRNIPCAWEASTDKARRYLLSIAHGITDILFEAKDEQRKWLHLSAVISNNFTNHLMAVCEQICKTNHIPFSSLHPIIEQTFERIKRESPFNIQTGPAIRGDAETINKHVVLLQQEPDWQHIYQSVSTSIENMYRTERKEKDTK